MVANFVAGGAAVNVLADQVGRERRRGRRGGGHRAPRCTGAPPVEGPARHRRTWPRAGHDRGRGRGGARRRRGARGRTGRPAGRVPAHRRHGHRQHDPVGCTHRVAVRPGRRRGDGPRDRDRRRADGPQGRDRRGPPSSGPPAADPVGLLASLGGLEIAALAGYIVGGAAAGVPVLLDGVIAMAAALVATALRARVRRLPGRRPPLHRARGDGRPRAPGSRRRCSTSGCGSGRGRARAWRSRSCRRRPGCSARWRPSTPPASAKGRSEALSRGSC